MTTNSQKSPDAHDELLRAWQLAILRFAVTLDNGDRLNVLALAAEVDRLGAPRTDASLHFFRRTSVEMCLAILGELDDADAIMARFHGEIGDRRLKRALAAAVGMARDRVPVKKRAKPENHLFRGLPSRKAHV